MAKKEERFEVIFRDGSSLKDDGVRQILVDKETGVNFRFERVQQGANAPYAFLFSFAVSFQTFAVLPLLFSLCF